VKLVVKVESYLSNVKLGGNLYALLIVDDFSRFTWPFFLAAKSDTFHAFKKLPRF